MDQMLATCTHVGKLDRAKSKRAGQGRAFAGQLLLLSIIMELPGNALTHGRSASASLGVWNRSEPLDEVVDNQGDPRW